MAGARRRAVRPHSVVGHRAGHELEPRANSALLLERFADTNNPGYFVIKLALLLLALLVLAEGVIEMFRPASRPR